MQPLVISKAFTDPLLEEEFRAFESSLLVHARHHGQSDALNQLPASASDYRHLIGNYLHSETEGFIHAAAGKLQTFSGMVTSKQLDASYFNQTAPLQAQLTRCDIDIAHTSAECKCLAPNQAEQVKYVVVQICLVVMSVAEGIMAFQPLRYMDLPRYAACIGALSIAATIYLGCEFAGRWIKKAKVDGERIFRYSLVLGAYAVGFYELARIRAQGYRQAALGFSDAQSVHPSPCAAISIFVVSLLIFSIGLLAAVKTSRSAEQVRQRDAYQKARKELTTLQSTRVGIANEIADTERYTAANSLESRQRHEYAAALYGRIIASANKAKELYITTNIRSRGGAPPQWVEDIPPMRFSLFTHTQTQQS